ncbi:MAG: L,D-transpeptidase family protein [Candidatus Desulfofervidus auxilii]|nr:L,D-transpeptidase family protein [Candidatus Desulfofervidus auxilii]
MFKCIFLFIAFFIPNSLFAAGAYPYHVPNKTVIGVILKHKIKKEETMLDIARRYGLGYQELMLLYPNMDPWLPPAGKTIEIPTQWVLPHFKGKGLVINVAELRLFLFLSDIGLVKTYPVGIGVQEFPTPFGDFKVIEKKKNPIWQIPPSLRKEYGGRFQILPGPENPLGKFWIGLSADGYGIHGTNSPWGIGRLVSHGCIRLYPEDIKELFPFVKIGMPVKIIYEPVKFGFLNKKIYVEVHPDIYHKIVDLFSYGIKKAKTLNLLSRINLNIFLKALKEKKGIPINVTYKTN